MERDARGAHLDTDGDAIILRLAGEIDLDLVSEMRPIVEVEIGRRDCRSVTVDLGAVTFIDCSGLSFLIAISRLAGEQRARFRLVNVGARCARVIELAGLAEVLGLRGRREPS
ncbi:MAG: STAS domain-containing protein [Jatrophihabitans sp.]|uniref:STAS domain-containing protein n=1 Tax=Jatrophihabitans sp. TaxID=1932789 RepID=UPI003911E210